MLHRLVRHQLLLLAPLHQTDQRVPQDDHHLGVAEAILRHVVAHQDNQLRGRRLVRLNLVVDLRRQLPLHGLHALCLLIVQQLTESAVEHRAAEGLLVALREGQKLQQLRVERRLAQRGPHIGRILLRLPGGEAVEEKLKGQALLHQLVAFQERLERRNGDVAAGEQVGEDLGQLQAVVRGEGAQEDDDLLQVLLQRLLEVLVAANETDKDLWRRERLYMVSKWNSQAKFFFVPG